MRRDLKALAHFGLTKERLREIFTAQDPNEDQKNTLSDEQIKRMENNCRVRKEWEKDIEAKLQEGVTWSIKQSRLYQAVDIAWDSIPIQDQTIPLLLYAQGKIDVDRCGKYLKDLDCSEEFIEKDKSGEVIKVNLPRLYEVSVNLIRSFLTRRVAAQSSRFKNLYPFLKYESRGTRPVDKFSADVFTQRAEIMTDQFNYRHLLGEQTIRDMFLYARSLVFPTSAWTVNKQMVEERTLSSTSGGSPKYETKIMSEGLDLFNPHPSRCFWDNSYPLANINTDNGPRHIGYWDILRYRDVHNVKGYFNRDHISYSNNFNNLPNTYNTYFDYYFDPCAIKFPCSKQGSEGFRNDRTSNIGTYTTSIKDDALFVTQLSMKVNPSDMGLAEYPYDVWIRLTVASDNTVIFAEPLSSLPAAYGGINENDNRCVNSSMAHELMPYQDQLSNILSQMLLNMKSGLAQIWMIDQDAIDEDIREDIKKWINSEEYYAQPKAMFYSGTKMKDMGLDPRAAVHVIQVSMAEKINESMKAITQLLQLAEKMMILSPQELGQAAPREISATEVSMIASTSNSIFTFISGGPDEQRAAVKEMIFDGLISSSEDDIAVSTMNRYPASVVEEAGFSTPELVEDEGKASKRNVTGNIKDLRHDILFTSRDGAERETNLQGAQTLTQLITSLMGIPGVAEDLGKDRLYEIINEIARKTGADFNLDPDEELTEGVIEQITQTLEALNTRVQQMEMLAQGAPPAGLPPELAGTPPPEGLPPELAGAPPALPLG
jgi:hypothetical protein|tara:strand:- start:18145 stop:20457 length:2313 start_codon:yes stop_codon:yes gene_type:complete